MNLKKQTTLIFILYCSLVCSQMPIHKIEKNCSKNINYKLQNKGSNITLNDSLGFIQKLQNEKTISNFVIKDRPQISVAITSLDIIRIKRGNLNFNKFKKSQYKPDIMLNEFIEKNISFESFINIDKKKDI